MKHILRCLMTVMLTMMISSQVAAGEIPKAHEKVNISRTINIDGSQKYTNVYLDEEVYQYAGEDLRDVRVIDENGNSIPYYIYNEDTYIYYDQQAYSAKIIEDFVKDDKEYFDIAIEQEENKDHVLCYLEFDITNSNFATSVMMQGSFDGKTWDNLNNGEETQLYKVAAGSQMRFYFDQPVKYSFFRMSMPRQTKQVDICNVNAVYENTEYQLQSFSKDKKSQFKMITDKGEKLSTITIDNKEHLRVRRLILNISGMFNREYTVYGIDSSDMRRKLDCGRLSSTDINAEKSEIAIDVELERVYEGFIIEVANLDDQPLEINEIREVYSIDKLVFEGKQGKCYTLTYGNKELDMPQYDIGHYIEQIEAVEQNNGSLGSVEFTKTVINQPKKEKDHTLLLKVLIGITSMILIIVIISSGRKQVK